MQARCLAGGGSSALRITALPPGRNRGGIRSRWTMMVDSSNDLGLRMSLRKTRGRAGVAGGKSETGESYRDSWRPCPSIYHSRIIGPCGYSGAREREREREEEIILPPLSSLPFRSPVLSLQDEQRRGREGGVERLILAVTLFSCEKLDPIFPLGSM